MQRSRIRRASGSESMEELSSRVRRSSGSEAVGDLSGGSVDRQPSGPLMRLLHQGTNATSSSEPLWPHGLPSPSGGSSGGGGSDSGGGALTTAMRRRLPGRSASSGPGALMLQHQSTMMPASPLWPLGLPSPSSGGDENDGVLATAIRRRLPARSASLGAGALMPSPLHQSQQAASGGALNSLQHLPAAYTVDSLLRLSTSSALPPPPQLLPSPSSAAGGPQLGRGGGLHRGGTMRRASFGEASSQSREDPEIGCSAVFRFPG